MDLKSTKIWIGGNPELCRKVQEKLFELGWKWNSGRTEVSNLNSAGLTLWSDGLMCYLNGSRKNFEDQSFRGIFPQHIGIVNESMEQKSEEMIIKNNASLNNELKELLAQIKDIK